MLDKKQIFQDIKNNAYCVLKKLSRTEFYELSSHFGRILKKSDVVIHDSPVRFVHTNRAMKFHTDNPECRFIMWQCKNLGPDPRPTYLIKSAELLKSLSTEERKVLTKIPFFYQGIFDKEIKYMSVFDPEVVPCVIGSATFPQD